MYNVYIQIDGYYYLCLSNGIVGLLLLNQQEVIGEVVSGLTIFDLNESSLVNGEKSLNEGLNKNGLFTMLISLLVFVLKPNLS